MIQNVLSKCNRQLNKNNKGASLVTVLVIVSIISVLVTVLLAVTILNVYMKRADLKGQSTFYDAETALEEIRAGLAVEVSAAASKAYVDTLRQYGDLVDEAKNRNFEQVYAKNLRDKLALGAGSDFYDVDKLTAYLRETKFDESLNIGAKILTVTPDNYINVTNEGFVLKNVIVSYLDADGFRSQIKTDICLEYPPIDFQNISSMDNVLCYGLIANDKFIANKGSSSTIYGNAFLGTDGADISNTTINFESNSAQEENVISGGNLTLKNNAQLNVDGVQLWGDSLALDNSRYMISDGATYLKNDLVLGNNSFVDMAGKFIMFGNPWVALGAKSVDPAYVMANMPSYSSSILVNGEHCGIDLSKLTTMVIGGSAYINAKSSGAVVMGQSLAIKSDQRAYLIPPSVVGAGYNNGMANPMTGEQYNELLTEIVNAKGYTDITEVKQEDVVDFASVQTGIGVSLESLNVHGYRLCAYPTTAGTMVYLFMEFSTMEIPGMETAWDVIPAEAFANQYYRGYNSFGANLNRLKDNLDYYATYGIKLPKNVDDKSCMYFTGNLIAKDPDAVIVPDIITQPDFTADLNKEYSAQSVYYQDAFYTLCKNLTTDYIALTSTEKSNRIFDNIIDRDAITSDKYYVSVDGEAAAVIKGDYTVNSVNMNAIKNHADRDGNKHSDAKCYFIIATGDVSVEQDYEGVIIAGGNISIRNGATITSNPDKAALAMCAPLENDINDTPAKYVYNSSHYLVGGVGTTDAKSGVISLSSFITYRNWTKQ